MGECGLSCGEKEGGLGLGGFIRLGIPRLGIASAAREVWKVFLDLSLGVPFFSWKASFAQRGGSCKLEQQKFFRGKGRQ